MSTYSGAQFRELLCSACEAQVSRQPIFISLRSRAERDGGLDTEKRELEREIERGGGVG